jgi:hypothetical protein
MKEGVRGDSESVPPGRSNLRERRRGDVRRLRVFAAQPIVDDAAMERVSSSCCSLKVDGE